jgi:hypothetical protein
MTSSQAHSTSLFLIEEEVDRACRPLKALSIKHEEVWDAKEVSLYCLQGKCMCLLLEYYVMSVLYTVGEDYRLHEFRRLFFHV